MPQNKSTLSIHGGLVPDSIVQWIIHICEVYICGLNQPQIKMFDLSRNQMYDLISMKHPGRQSSREEK